MRKYFDADGKPTTAANATSSKGFQGGCGRALAIALGLLIVVFLISLIAH